MNVHLTELHLDADEPIHADRGTNHDAINIGGLLDRLRLVLPHTNGADRNAAWLRNLAGELTGLADLLETGVSA